MVSPKNVQLVVSVMPAVLAIRFAVALETIDIGDHDGSLLM